MLTKEVMTCEHMRTVLRNVKELAMVSQVLLKGRFPSFMSGMWSRKTVPDHKSKISTKLQEVSSWTSAPERILASHDVMCISSICLPTIKSLQHPSEPICDYRAQQ